MFLEPRGQYIYAKNPSKSQQPPSYFSDISWSFIKKIELTCFGETEQGNSSTGEYDEEAKSYGIQLERDNNCMVLINNDFEKIDLLFIQLSHYCLLSDFTDDFIIENNIGKGKFGQVLRVTSKFDTSRSFAAKVYDKNTLKSKHERNLLINEINVLRALNTEDNEFCLSLKYLYEDKEYIYLVTDIYDGDNLLDYYQNNVEEFSELTCIRIIYRVMQALCYLEKHKIIHRDIKCSNMMIKGSGKPYDIAIIDFGFACYTKQIKKETAEDSYSIGSPGYMAPEMLMDKIYDCKADIFSAGVCLHML